MSTPTEFAAAAQALAAALSSAASSPADSIRLLNVLASFYPDDVTSDSPIGEAMATLQSASGDLFRRAAVVALARASSEYEPSSADDAAAVRAAVCGALDAEITVAADQYEDATYKALRTLRSAVSADLTARGAGLASIGVVACNLPLPALALAQRQYRDGMRSDELVAQSACIHPAFMPTSFKALSR